MSDFPIDPNAPSLGFVVNPANGQGMATGANTPQPRFPDVQGRCPACNGESLMLADGGYITCRRLDCPNPCAADDLLHGEQPAPGTAATEATGVPDIITDPEWLRQQYAAAMYRLKCPYGAPWEDTLPTDRPPFLQLADAVLAVRDRHLLQLRQRLELADAELDRCQPQEAE